MERGREKATINPTLTAPQIMKQFKVSRTTAWRARSRGWLFVNYHTKEVTPDSIWADAHIEEMVESAAKGVWSYLRRRADKAARTIRELCAPFEPEDVIQQAVLRLIELSGHQKREFEGWRVVVAQHAAADFVDAILIRTRNNFELLDNSRTGSQQASIEDIEDSIELAKASFRDLVPEEILEIAAKTVSGENPTKKEQGLLRQFREQWNWLVE